MAGWPTGTVTFVFTDIEGSTHLLQHLGDDDFEALLGQHHKIMRAAIAAHNGAEVSTEGDAFFVVFQDAVDAVAMAHAVQLSLGRHIWPAGAAFRVRVGLHTGLGRLGGDNYVGLAVHQAARISSAAHGGQVVASQATRDAAGESANGISWRPLGRHRLKDIAAPVELFQLCHADLGGTFPPLRSLERVAHNLPVQLSSFLGRRDELALGRQILGATRLLTVTGPGGTGKSRLAFQLAADELDQFPDGVWLTELASVADPELAPAAVMASIGVRDEPGRSATETIVSHLRSRRALVLLDNCEHVVDTAAALAGDLLQGCREIRVLATSRQPLRVAGESVWVLPPLRLPEAALRPLAEIAACDAVALFCERAAEAKVGFVLGPDNVMAVTAICTRLEGIPLAIELAASRVRTLPLTEIAQRLSHSLDVLSKAARGAAGRQASLRAAVTWSHDLLSDTEQVLFRRLAVFVGGFTLEAGEHVCAGEPLEISAVLDTLDGLVDKSLVALSEERAGEGRYRLLETIRTYASERLERAGERQLLAGQHAAHFAQLARKCAEGGDAPSVLDRLEADHPNLLVALDHLSGGDQSGTLGQLVVDMSSFWDLRGHWRLGRRELLGYLARSEGDTLDAYCAFGLATIAIDLGDSTEAHARYEQARMIAREFGQRRLEAACLRGLARVASRLAEVDAARACLKEAISIAREVADRRAEGRCVGDLGILATNLGDYLEARANFEEGLAIAREVGDRRFEGYWVGDLGDVALYLGDYPDAEAHFSEALNIAREVGERRLEGFWLGDLGEIATRRGELPEASTRYHEALHIARDLGDRRCEGLWTGGLGDVACSLGEYAEARARFEQAYSIACEVGDRGVEGLWIGGLGTVAFRLGDLGEARARFGEALRLAREIGDRRFEGWWISGLGDVALIAGDQTEARARFEEALVVASELGRKDVLLLASCAGLFARIDQCRVAVQLLGAVDDLNTRAGRSRTAWEQDWYDDALARCRDRLDEEALDLARRTGRRLGWSGAVDTALAALRGDV